MGSRFFLVAVLAAPAAGQAPGWYVESVTTEVFSRTATAEHTRSLERVLRVVVSRRGDTTVVQVVSAQLTERDAGGTVGHDTDGFTGGRWKLLPDSTGVLRVIDRPFVPPALSAVNDLAAAMDAFFPPMPPPLAVGEHARDARDREWRRDADSAAVRRYRWDATVRRDSTAIVRDTLSLQVVESSRESATLALDAQRAPLAWRRDVTTEVESRGAGAGVRATIRQRIAVRMVP